MAWPLALVATTVWWVPDAGEDARGTEAGAAKVTLTLGTGLPNWSTVLDFKGGAEGGADRRALVVALHDGQGVVGGLRGDRDPTVPQVVAPFLAVMVGVAAVSSP